MPHDQDPTAPRPGGLHVDVRRDGDAVIVALAGELDLATVGELERAMQAARDAGAGVVVDLRRLSFMDSTGLRAIVLAHEELDRAGQKLAIVRGPGPVQRVFELTGLEQRLTFLD